METNQLITKKTAINHIQPVSFLFCTLGIILCFIVMFFVLGKYRYTEVAKFFDDMPTVAKYILTLSMKITIFILTYKLVCLKKKAKLIYAVPFVVGIISTAMYWQGLLRVTDPTEPVSVQLLETAVQSTILPFLLISIVEAIIIVLIGVRLNLHYARSC